MPTTPAAATPELPTRRRDAAPPGGSGHARAAVVSSVTALRWGAVAYGTAVVASAGAANDATDVVALAVCVFLTALRTVAPLDLGSTARGPRSLSLVDVAALSLVAGWTGAQESPWAYCAMVAIALAAFGWGARHAVVAVVLAVACTTLGTVLGGLPFDGLVDSRVDLAVVFTTVVAATVAVVARRGLQEAEARTVRATSELVRLRQANLLLGELSEVALTLPGAFTLREALERTRGQVATFLRPKVISLVVLDEHNDEWTPKLTHRCALRASYRPGDLPEPLRRALQREEPVARSRIGDGEERLDPGSSSGLYLPLRARDQVIGVLGLEHPDAGHFDDVDPVVRDGLADLIALSIDNARWFGRLRTLGAEEERIRVARDIHDRLGQWITYLKLELERLAAGEEIPRHEVERLRDDAGAALDELRETLRQLRSGVSDDRPLADLARDLVDRFADRADVAARLSVTHPGQRLPVPVENELLRILQEALNNVDRHAKAGHVDVRWTVEGGNFELVVADDGRGFEPDRAVREQSYGLVGMRERAEVIGARLRVDSHPGSGTRVTVSAGQVRDAPRGPEEDGATRERTTGRDAPRTGDDPT